MDYTVWNSPGQNTGGCSHSLLQGIFLTQGSNPSLPHCRQILYQLSHQGNKNTVMGILSFLQWIFLTQKSNWGLLHCRWILYQPSYQGSPAQLQITEFRIFISLAYHLSGFPSGSAVKNLPAVQETRVRSLNQEDPLEEGMTTQLQYSCLGSPMDRGVWWATVLGVTKSQTQLKRPSTIT